MNAKTTGFNAVSPRALRWQRLVDVVEIVHSQTELLDVVRALHTTSRLASRLDGGKKQTNQNADDRDNDQQLDERKALEFSP